MPERVPPGETTVDLDDDEPGFTTCLECGEEIPDDDNEAPYCGRCWRMLEEEGFFDGPD